MCVVCFYFVCDACVAWRISMANICAPVTADVLKNNNKTRVWLFCALLKLWPRSMAAVLLCLYLCFLPLYVYSLCAAAALVWGGVAWLMCEGMYSMCGSEKRKQPVYSFRQAKGITKGKAVSLWENLCVASSSTYMTEKRQKAGPTKMLRRRKLKLYSGRQTWDRRENVWLMFKLLPPPLPYACHPPSIPVEKENVVCL